MAYMVPLRFVQISRKRSDNRQFDVSICATRIVAIMSTEIYQARKTLTTERQNGTLINGCGQAKAKSAIFLDNGSVVSSPLSVKRLMAIIDKSNEKAGSKVDKRMRVYDVHDSEADEKEGDAEEISADIDDDGLDYDEEDFE